MERKGTELLCTYYLRVLEAISTLMLFLGRWRQTPHTTTLSLMIQMLPLKQSLLRVPQLLKGHTILRLEYRIWLQIILQKVKPPVCSSMRLVNTHPLNRWLVRRTITRLPSNLMTLLKQGTR